MRRPSGEACLHPRGPRAIPAVSFGDRAAAGAPSTPHRWSEVATGFVLSWGLSGYLYPVGDPAGSQPTKWIKSLLIRGGGVQDPNYWMHCVISSSFRPCVSSGGFWSCNAEEKEGWIAWDKLLHTHTHELQVLWPGPHNASRVIPYNNDDHA